MTIFGLLRQYWRSRKRDFMLTAGFVGVFAAVFSLYKVSFEPLVYAVILSAALALLFLTADFWRFAERHRILEQLGGQATSPWIIFPQPLRL